ncbi:MAG: glycosyltransferase family 2 protein [Anaerolineae bacterium]|nr:glycosyltransferase family 2 protein [Anaerolineae bacterium]
METLSVVIPAYNEEDGIAEIAERVTAIRPLLRAQDVALEVIVVDDGSRDKTAEIAACCPEVRLIQHQTNYGYGAALKTGFAHAQGEWLGFLDADGTYPPEHFPALLQAGREQDADLVIGSRMAGADSQMPLSRRIGNIFFAVLVSLIGNRRISDSASGMRVLRRDALPHLYPLPDGLNFTPVMSTRAIHEDLKMVELPIPYAERVGRSKLTIVGDGTRFLQSILWTALDYNPVRILGFAGLTCLALAALLGMALVVLRLRGVTELDTRGTAGLFAVQVLVVMGVSIFSLGATFNYLVSLFHKQSVRQGLFGQRLFHPPLEHHFGWIGVLSFLGGLVLGGISLRFGFTGWPVSRLWLYLLGSAMLILVGVQFQISWVVMRVLAGLNERERMVTADLDGHTASAPVSLQAADTSA